MKFNDPRIAVLPVLALTFGLLSGCGGTKVLKEPEPLQTTRALATGSDQQITATLDWVIVRDGPGTWAKNADWDEYLLRVSNMVDEPLRLTRITVVDSLDTPIGAETGRKKLVKGSKQTARRFKDADLKVKAGRGAGTMLVAGAAVTVVGVGAGAVAFGSVMSAGAAGAGGAAAVAGGLLLLGPALAVGGVVRGLSNSAVNKQIETRQTAFPVEIPAGEELAIDVFFPVAPSPRQIVLTYSDMDGEHTLIVDTQASLDGLHLIATDE